jgi:DNA polymerase III epsilon subunit-like protein
MSYYVVDVEADGPYPGDYSMVSIGIVKVTSDLNTTFYREIKPISDKYVDGALKACKMTREQTENFSDDAEKAMTDCVKWINETNVDSRAFFISDNNGFDWMFTNYYLHKFGKSNPFGHSSTNLNSLYKGLVRNMKQNMKFLRSTKHTHNALDDAKGNAEALIKINNKFKLNMKFV